MAKKKTPRVMKPVAPPELRAQARKKLRELARRRQRPLLWYHDVGTILNHEVPVVAGEKRRGAIRKIAEIYFRDVRCATTLSSCRRFARVVDRSEVRNEMREISWGAALVLMSVENRRLRRSFTKQVLTRGLKVRQLRLLIQESFGKRSGGGKLAKVPQLGPRSALSAIEHLSKDWVRHCSQWVDNTVEGEIPVGKESEALVRSAITAVRELAQQIKPTARRLHDVRRRVQRSTR